MRGSLRPCMVSLQYFYCWIAFMNSKVNFLNYNLQQLRSFLERLGEKPFRAQQIMRWIHQLGLSDFRQMTNLSKLLQQKLHAIATITPPTIINCQLSQDGTCKWLLKLDCGNCIEMVFIPEKNRGTLCVSSQVGCALNCTFCVTGKQGFNRNLTTAEIIGQVWLAARQLSGQAGIHDRKITNVVMMGMGEPLLNFDNVVAAMDIMLDDLAYGLSKRRVTLSTTGIIPKLKQLREVSPVALAISLHAPNDELRNQLVPINKKYPLQALMSVCKTYFNDEPKRLITFEYVMLKGINDQPEHAEQLIGLMHNMPAKVNLIPFNTFPFAPYERSCATTIEAFRIKLLANRINTITRKTRGEDIAAACGLLAGNLKDRTNRAALWEKVKQTTQQAS